MEKKHYIFLLIVISFYIFGPPIRGQTKDKPVQSRPIGYVDANRDGINDLFHDADGDGKNDVTLMDYKHHFQFVDKNKDGLNDLWLDKDGDGVNDLLRALLAKRGIKPQKPWIDKDGDGILDADVLPKYKTNLRRFVLDADRNGKNDITGLDLRDDNSMGYRFGLIDEESNKKIKKFVDKNGDGMFDAFEKRRQSDSIKHGPGRKHDYFIDNDGDGLADDRGMHGLMKNKPGRRHGKKRKP